MIVVLDANVLYPPSLRDLLLTLAVLDAFDVRWSDEILDEVTRNVIAKETDVDPIRFVEHTIGSMRAAFPDAVVPASADLIASLDNDPKDRHAAATALLAGAKVIVTQNISDFESDVLDEAGVQVATPGQLVDGLLDEVPEVVVAAVDAMSVRWVNPRRTPAEIVDLLGVHPSMSEPADRLRALIRE